MAALRARQARRAGRRGGALKQRRGSDRPLRDPDRQAVVARRRRPLRCRWCTTSARARPGAVIDWVVEPGFAPLLAPRRRASPRSSSARCGAGAAPGGRASVARRAARLRRPPAPRALRRDRRPAGPDQVGAGRALARGMSYGLANRTDGASHEAPARWLVDHRDPRRAAHPRAGPLARAGRRAALGYAARGRRRRSGSRRSDVRRCRRRGRRCRASSTAPRATTSSGPRRAWIELGQRARATKAGASRCRRPTRSRRRARERDRRGDRRPQRDGLAGARARRGDRPHARRPAA